MVDHKDYWVKSVESSFGEHGVTATAEQIERVAGDMQGSSENEGMAFGDDVASANWAGEKEREIAELAKALEDERRKVHCETCGGKGYIRENYGTRSSESSCYKCHGEGRHAP